MESMLSILQTTNLEGLQKESLTIKTSNEDSVSVYQGGQLTRDCVVNETQKILVAFPKIEPQMIDLLRERFKANVFNDDRIRDAVAFVIDNYTGFDKLPAIADFVRYDKRVKIWDYDSILRHTKDYSPDERGAFWNTLEKIDVNGELRWAKKEDVKQFNLKKYIKQVSK